jgi:hypothetical protein
MVAYKVMARPTIPNFLLVFCLAVTVQASDDNFHPPDTIILKNGRTAKGLIVKNTRDEIWLQTQLEEVRLPKSEIVRIVDRADDEAIYTTVPRKGELPSWRVIANDLRSNDAVKSLVEIPATLIDNGEFKNVPYKSFRVNDSIELNVYGDPENPAAIELGIFGWKSGLPKLRKTLRGYLAGFLTTRDELAKLYSLNLNGGLAESGALTMEITPKDAPDAYGAWWVSIYNKKQLDDARLDDAEYDRLVKPFDQVIDKRGRVIAHGWTDEQLGESERMDASSKVLLRGFYRDKDGVFRLITEPVKAEN